MTAHHRTWVWLAASTWYSRFFISICEAVNIQEVENRINQFISIFKIVLIMETQGNLNVFYRLHLIVHSR